MGIKLIFVVDSADTGSAGGYLIFILPVSFITWYRPIYLGFSRTEGKAMAFFFCKQAPGHA